MNETAKAAHELGVESFIAHWSQSSGAERANFQSFAKDFCRLLEVPEPEPTRGDPSLDNYTFEYGVRFKAPDGAESLASLRGGVRTAMRRRFSMIVSSDKIKEMQDGLLYENAKGENLGAFRFLASRLGRFYHERNLTDDQQRN